MGSFCFVSLLLVNSDDLKRERKKKKKGGWIEHASHTRWGENKALYVFLFCLKEKKKVLRFRDDFFFSFFFFLAKVWRANSITFPDCKLLLLVYIMNLTLLSMCI